MRNIVFLLLVMQLNCFSQVPVFPFRDGGLWGVVDGNLKEIVEPVYHHMNFFTHFESENAVAIVTDMAGYKGLINRKGEQLLNHEYYNLTYTDDENGVILYQTYPEKRYGLYSIPQKKIVINPRYEAAPALLHVEITTLLIVKENGKYGVIRSDGSLVVPIQYEQIKPFSVEKCPWISAHSESNVVYYDCKGVMFTEKPKTSFEVSEFISIGGESIVYDQPQSKMPPVTMELVNKKLGKGATIQTKFQNGSGEHFAVVQANNKTGMIDGNGVIRVPVEYDAIKDGIGIGGLLVEKNRLLGWIDISPAKVIIEPAYDELYNPYFKFGKLKATARYAMGSTNMKGVFIELKTGKVFYPIR